MQRSYLNDSAFLKIIDGLTNKEQVVKITVLTFDDEKPIASIEGKVTSGSISLNGDSAIRRTANLSMVASEVDNDLTDVNNLLSINKKVSIEMGVYNSTQYYTDFPILWFPLGVYVIINPSLSHSLDGVNITLQLKDKMCLLNGECGGVIPASTEFHQYETIDENGEYVIVKPTIYQIIQEAVNHFGGEQLGRIIISDLDTRVKQVMKWTGSSPLYLCQTTVDNTSYNYLTTNAQSAQETGGVITTFTSGEDVGYIYTDFTYPDELIGDEGSSVVDILEKIKSTLGNYEYFYDVYGNFHFQEIKNYLNTSQATVELNNLKNDDYLMDMSKGKAVYVFDDSTLVTSYSHSPQYNMIKNDFVVWGIRKDANDNSYPIRYHLAIDSKPKVGNKYKVFLYTDPDDGLTKAKRPMEYDSKDSFPATGQAEVFYYANNVVYKWGWIEDEEKYGYIALDVIMTEIETADWRTELYLQGVVSDPLATDSNYYYTELKNEWTKLYDIKNKAFLEDALSDPTGIDFFLDFIDSTAAISEFSVSNIGRRSKVVNDDSINCVFEPEIPDLILLDNTTEDIKVQKQECEEKGQNWVQVDGNIYSLLATGGSFNSAYNMVRELLYQYTSYNSTISVAALPVFYLEPNVRITVRDTQSGIYGDFMINSITLPFDANGTMSLSCTRALERI